VQQVILDRRAQGERDDVEADRDAKLDRCRNPDGVADRRGVREIL
jgi:hypothetical protein